MSFGHIHCQVLEMPRETSAANRLASHGPVREDSWPRDLLPWADPYIALLMQRLEDRYEQEDAAFEDSAPDLFNKEYLGEESWDGEDIELERLSDPIEPYPPIYGGFPLLNDASFELEDDVI